MANPCPVCGNPTDYHDLVDFNRSCLDVHLGRQPLSGIPIYYCLCGICGFLHAPAFQAWSVPDFLEKIYNDSYADFDPDYTGARPASGLIPTFGALV